MDEASKGPPDGVWPRGHTVLQVPMPELEDVVRERTAHYDTGFLSQDPDFVHAHVTALGPFLSEPSAGDLALVAQIAAQTPAFDVVLAEVDVFPDGIIYLRPDPDAGFRHLTARLVAAFPGCAPYDGRWGGLEALVPHLTLDLRSPGVSVASTRRLLGPRVPVAVRAERLDLAWYESGACRRLASWRLGG